MDFLEGAVVVEALMIMVLCCRLENKSIKCNFTRIVW